jgi:RinA family phage transcriptional activator
MIILDGIDKGTGPLMDDILNRSPAPPDGMPRGTEVSNPTLSKIVKRDQLLTCRRTNQMHRTTYAISRVLIQLPSEKTKLVELKYWQHPRQYTDIGIAMYLHISERALYNWIDDILTAIAIELGYINSD